MVGTVALLMENTMSSEPATGGLIVFDPLGKTLEVVANGVREINNVSVSPSGDLVLLYDRNRQFVLTVLDGATLKVKQEKTFEIPPVD